MVFDRNPQFGKDQSFAEGAVRATDFLWENTQGDVTSFPKSYLENLRYDFSDGDVSMLELMDRVDLGPNATYEDYCEVRDTLIKVDPNSFPDPDAVVEVIPENLLYEVEPELDFVEFFSEDFAEGDDEGLSDKIEMFLSKVISSVYLDGVTNVTDKEGNPPNPSNNYLLSDDGTSFSGVFYDQEPNGQTKTFPFSITEGKSGKWSIKY
jgi:hypothetical protein